MLLQMFHSPFLSHDLSKPLIVQSATCHGSLSINSDVASRCPGDGCYGLFKAFDYGEIVYLCKFVPELRPLFEMADGTACKLFCFLSHKDCREMWILQNEFPESEFQALLLTTNNICFEMSREIGTRCGNEDGTFSGLPHSILSNDNRVARRRGMTNDCSSLLYFANMIEGLYLRMF